MKAFVEKFPYVSFKPNATTNLGNCQMARLESNSSIPVICSKGKIIMCAKRTQMSCSDNMICIDCLDKYSDKFALLSVSAIEITRAEKSKSGKFCPCNDKDKCHVLVVNEKCVRCCTNSILETYNEPAAL